MEVKQNHNFPKKEKKTKEKMVTLSRNDIVQNGTYCFNQQI